MTTPAPELSPGTVIDGYTIGAKVRTRSGAATYAARNSSGADVHFTAYAEACFPTALIRERSLRELRQLQGVEASQVARVLDCGKLEEGGVYEVSEVVIGEALGDAGQLSRPEVGATMTAIGEALLAAQKVGVIHRNLGGGVVFATERGLKVTGFAVGEPQEGGAFGLIDTIAPEQVTNKVVDQRTLIYNLAALAHQLLTGQPLFTGSVAEKLDLHANREAANVDTLLKRALSKDPRMRPMMLKQFVTELGKFSDGAAPGPSAPKPSTRGWTMFMEAQEAEAAPVAAPKPAPAPAPISPAPAPAPISPAPAPAPAAPAASPSTRGWTMFMEAEEPAAAQPPAAAPIAPNPAVAAPAPAPAAPEPAPAAAPSTRGWTMFMEAEEGPAAAAPAAAVTPAPSPVVPAPAQPAPPQPAAAAPSTRGWTMFMEAEEGPAAGTPAAPPASPAPPPSTVAPAPVAPVPAPAPAAPAPAAAKPSTRGWTMFMEAETPAAPEPEPAPAPTASAPTTRGWTMFMEAEVPGEPAAEAAPPVDEPATPSQVGASDSKGWTVFMERQPIPPPTEPPAPAPISSPPAVAEPPVSGRTVIMGDAVEPEPPAREVSAPVPAAVPATPVIETRPAQPPHQPAPQMPPPSVDYDEPAPKNKMPLYIGIGLGVVALIVILIFALKN